MRNQPRPQEIYRHFKGELYQIVSLAAHSETGEELVIYQALYDDYRIFARPLSMFMDEIDPRKYRFTLLEKNARKENNAAPVTRMSFTGTKASELSAAEIKISAVNETELKKSGCEAELMEAELMESELIEAELIEAELIESELNEAELKKVDPLVLEFLGADSYDKRLQILTILQPRITDNMINTMAISLDLEIADGQVEKRYDELRHCLLTMKKFEINR